MIGAKVFGIGFHKTGTSSLRAALQQLGYRVAGTMSIRDPDLSEAKLLEQARCLLTSYDAFQDNPWPLLYRQLDDWCPGSRFILTLRPLDEWVQSVVRHFGERDTAMRAWIYGVGHPAGHEDIYRERHARHVRDVREYFDGRPDDLLELRITEGEGWDRLCPFLGHDVPVAPFPHSNPASERESVRARWSTRGREWLASLLARF